MEIKPIARFPSPAGAQTDDPPTYPRAAAGWMVSQAVGSFDISMIKNFLSTFNRYQEEQ